MNRPIRSICGVCSRKAVFAAIVITIAPVASGNPQDAESTFGRLEASVTSDYSTIRIRRKRNIRTMLFLRDNGDEIGETQIDVDRPHRLLVPYTQTMFASYFFVPKPKRVLIVGLGGGSMVHFLNHHAPEVRIDAVEIDPEVIKLAEKYFETRSGGNVTIHQADGLEFIETTKDLYDVIYMDAFLKPSAATDSVGTPLPLKTEVFYREAITKLTDDGVMAFNLNRHPKVKDDLRLLQRVFSQCYVYRASDTNAIVVGSGEQQRLEKTEMRNRGIKLDRQFRANFSFKNMIRTLK